MVLAAGVLSLFSGVSGAQDSADDPGRVDVIEVSGYLDPVLVDFVSRSIEDAEDAGSVALVLQLNSRGAVVSDEEIRALTDQMQAASVPVDVWVGPSSAKAYGQAADLVYAAEVSGMAPGTRIENPDGKVVDDEAAVEEGLVDVAAPTVGDFNVDLPGFETRTVDQDGEPRREPVTQTRFSQLSLPSELMHTVASPAVAYLLFVIGMSLILFEFFTAGVGVAGVVGAGCFILGCYGLATLPTNPVGIGLLVFSMFAFAVDIQTGVPRFWTGVGVFSYVVGTLYLYDQGVSLSWITLLVSFAGIVLAMVAGMPAMVRTRFATPTIGREWMVGEMGEAVAAVDPDGTVRVRDALWRARVNRATPIEAGDPVRVVGIAGMILEVEPEEGAARDYRERRSR